MRKIVLIASIVFITNLNACLCSGDIIQGFSSATNRILAVLNEAKMEIDVNVNPRLEKNIEDIEEQNKLLARIITGYKKRAEQKKEMIHHLTKLKGLQD